MPLLRFSHHTQRILSLVIKVLPNLTKRYEPVLTRLAIVKVSFRLASYQHVPPPSQPHLRSTDLSYSAMSVSRQSVEQLANPILIIEPR
jgi:hypothetical protein